MGLLCFAFSSEKKRGLKIHVQNLINEPHKDKNYSWQMLDKVRRILNDMYGRAIEDDFAIKNPTRGVRIPQEKGNSYHVLSKDEQALFFETSAGTFYDNLFNVAVNTGLRPGELFALTKADIDLKKKVIYVRKTLLYAKFEGEESKSFRFGPPKTKSSVREVPINAICEKYLYRQFTMKNMVSNRFPKDDEFVNLLFVTKLNTPLNVQICNDAIRRILDIRNEMLDVPQKCERAKKLGQCPRKRETADDRQRRGECTGCLPLFSFSEYLYSL